MQRPLSSSGRGSLDDRNGRIADAGGARLDRVDQEAFSFTGAYHNRVLPRAGDRFKRANIGKSDNTAEAEWAKITIRRNVLAEVGAEHASVFDAFAGEGRMHAAVWCEAARYVGCDTQFFTDDRPAFVADNRRVLRAIDLAAFNLFDLDSYGSPWEQAYIIARRRKLRPGERLGLVLTEGTGLASKLNTMSAAMALLAGTRTHIIGLPRMLDNIIDRALRRVATMMGGTIKRRWQAKGYYGSRMTYIGLVIAKRGGGLSET